MASRLWIAVGAAVGALALAPAAGAMTARDGLALAASAADAWADDARLVWVENDTPVDTVGQADAWGYLFYSPGAHALRSWSVRDGEIVRAEDHTVVVDAPAVDGGWQDSARAAGAAWAALEAEPRAAGAALENLVLARGIFASDTAWVAVFAAGEGPKWFVLLDAESAGVIKRWRG
jgi:hypothetical protein